MAVMLACLILGFVCDAAAQAEKAPKAKMSHGDLASEATNPAAPLIQLQLQDLYTPNSDNSSGYANSGIIQPVVPIILGKDHYFQSLIFRLTTPIVTTPKVGGQRTTALGDSTLLSVFAHKQPVGNEGDFWNFGPVLAMTIPTATEDETGSRKFSIGPGGLVLRNITNVFSEGDSLLVGVLGYQQWSVATVDGEKRKPRVDKLFAQPIVVYRFSSLFNQKGWYGGLPDDLWTYDFVEGEMTRITAGARLGKVFAIGKQPVNMFFQGWHNLASSRRGASAKYTFKLNSTFLFPE